MIVLSNSTTQTLAPGQALVFDIVKEKCGTCQCHRQNSSSVKMCSKGCYEVSFSGNITGATADVSVGIAIQLGGETLRETGMISTPSVANAFNNVSTSTIVKNCCCDYSRLTVVNVSTTTVIVGSDASFTIKEVCG